MVKKINQYKKNDNAQIKRNINFELKPLVLDFSSDDIISILPLLFIIGFVPLVVYLKVNPVDKNIAQYWTGDKNYDFFSYYKMVLFIFSTIVALVILIIKKIKKVNFEENPKKVWFYYVPIIAYSFFVIISAFLSEYRGVSFFGFPDRYEGMYTLLAYMAITVITIKIVDKEIKFKFMFLALFISATIITGIGIFQYFGMDFFKTSEGKLLILPYEYHNFMDSLQFQFGAYTIYTTLYNTNFVGSYTVMVLMITLSIFLFIRGGIKKTIFFILSCLIFSNWIGCLSRAGILGGVFALILFFILLRHEIIRQWKQMIAVVVSFSIIFFVMDYVSDGNLSGKVRTIKISEEDKIHLTAAIKKIYFKNNRVIFDMGSELLQIGADKKEFIFKDKNEKELEFFYDSSNKKFLFKNPILSSFAFAIDSNNKILELDVFGKPLYLGIANDGILKVVDYNMRFLDIVPIKRIGFEGREKLGTSRGYTWSRTFPLLEKTIFKGYGPDTYAIYFPQKDYLGKFFAYDGDPFIIVDKPHNMYLQIAVNTGVLSLISILFLFIYYFFTSIKLYIKCKFENFFEKAGIAIFFAFCGYCVTAVFNDSLVSVAPVFWIIFGLGIKANLIVEKMNNK